jgi:hypothetical protein
MYEYFKVSFSFSVLKNVIMNLKKIITEKLSKTNSALLLGKFNNLMTFVSSAVLVVKNIF